jgi:hypothetical protein
MDDFVDWFITVSRDGGEVCEELKTHYATVFAFVASGTPLASLMMSCLPPAFPVQLAGAGLEHEEDAGEGFAVVESGAWPPVGLGITEAGATRLAP